MAHPDASRVPDSSGGGSPPLTDSLWFWVTVFGIGGIVALGLAGPKYLHRQPQIERQFTARQAGGQAVVGTGGPVAPSTSERMIISLWPLYVMLGLLLTAALLGGWYSHTRRYARRRVSAQQKDR